jgi:hypothetical protein
MPEPILINSIPDWAAFGVGDGVFFLVAAAFPQRRIQCSEVGVRYFLAQPLYYVRCVVRCRR